ncbi:MAG: hypothetical protein ACRCUT_03915, partial [Spirochaetota bacterium]
AAVNSSLLHRSEDTDADLAAIVTALEAKKDIIWNGEDASLSQMKGYLAILQDESYVAGENKPAKDEIRERLQLLIRQLKQQTAGDRDAAVSINSFLLDEDYDRAELVDDSMSAASRREVLLRYAKIQTSAFEKIADAMDDCEDGEKNVNGMLSILSRDFSAYNYTEQSDEWLASKCAYEWVKANMGSAAAGEWNSLASMISDQSNFSEKIENVYSDGFDPATLYAAADGSDADAKAALKEYYSSGSQWQMLSDISAYDDALYLADDSSQKRKSFAIANWDTLANETHGTDVAGKEYDFRTQGYLVDMETMINNKLKENKRMENFSFETMGTRDSMDVVTIAAALEK